MRILVEMAERGWVPSPLVRRGIHRLLARRLRMEDAGTGEGRRRRLETWVRHLDRSPLALHPEKANRQHYELPAEFFQRVLGPHLKYSGCYWPAGVSSLEEAEAAMLGLSCRRAGLEDGQEVLELGCGWGSLTLWMARRFPGSRILAMSNSRSQREFILQRCAELHLNNVRVLTEDINDFSMERTFDRIVSVEMFEHLRNYRKLFKKLARWLRADGKLFVHVFCHRHLSYPFEAEGEDNWMGRHFFTGGLMPSFDLFEHVQSDLLLERRWWLDGGHYSRTAAGWLANLEVHRDEVMPILEKVYGSEACRWWHRWRFFFMACEELFGYRQGREWGVCHCLFGKENSRG